MKKFKQYLESNSDNQYELNSKFVKAIINRNYNLAFALISQGANVNTSNGIAIIDLIDKIDKENIVKLIDKGADINIAHGRPLIVALTNRNKDIIRLLINKGAKFDTTSLHNNEYRKFIHILADTMGQEYIFKNYPHCVKYINNPSANPELLKKYSQLNLGSKFNLFGDSENES